MSKINETLGYARGLLNAMSANENADKNAIELMNAMLTALEAQTNEIHRLDEQFNELDEYVESIDDDLNELELAFGDSFDDDMEMDDDEFDFYDDDNEFEDFDDEEDEHPLHLVKREHKCKCGHHHDEDHECHCHEEGHECHCHDDEDEDDEEMDLSGFDNLFLGAMCPECGRMFCVTDADFDDPDARYRCPYCEKDVAITPIDPASVPVAKRVQ